MPVFISSSHQFVSYCGRVSFGVSWRATLSTNEMPGRLDAPLRKVDIFPAHMMYTHAQMHTLLLSHGSGAVLFLPLQELTGALFWVGGGVQCTRTMTGGAVSTRVFPESPAPSILILSLTRALLFLC